MVSEFSPEGLMQISDQRLITEFVSVIWRNLRFSIEQTKPWSSSHHPCKPRPVLVRGFKTLPMGVTVIQP